MDKSIQQYNDAQIAGDKAICELLMQTIEGNLDGAESKVWHGHPVWFLDGNPIVGYAKRKNDIQLLFWSGQSFDEPGLKVEGTFKAAQLRITDKNQIVVSDLKRWLKKATEIQWDYKHIVKNKGVLHKLV